MDSKNAIKIYTPSYFAEYGYGDKKVTIPLPISDDSQMELLWDSIKAGMDLKLDGQIIKGSMVWRMYRETPQNEYEYLLSKIMDGTKRDRINDIHEEKKLARHARGPKQLWAAYQRIHLHLKDEDIEQTEDIDLIIKHINEA